MIRFINLTGAVDLFSPEYFAQHSEHVTLQGNTYSIRDVRTYRETLHPWELEHITTDEPFCHPSRTLGAK